MVIVTTSWQRWAAGLAASLVVFLVLYLTVIQPSDNTANQAVKAGMQQTQQASSRPSSRSAATATRPAPPRGTPQATRGGGGNRQQADRCGGSKANKQLSQARKLAACVAAAGTDTGKLQACQVTYTP